MEVRCVTSEGCVDYCRHSLWWQSLSSFATVEKVSILSKVVLMADLSCMELTTSVEFPFQLKLGLQETIQQMTTDWPNCSIFFFFFNSPKHRRRGK